MALASFSASQGAGGTCARFPKGATFILISQNSVKVHPQRPLPFTPALRVVPARSLRAFNAADELELREQQFDRAMALLQPFPSGLRKRFW